MEIKRYLQERKGLIDDFIETYISNSNIYPEALRESMAYSLTAKGKRIRPILCFAAYEACGGKKLKSILPFACAIEFIHTYSLIHDDLPAMDNDDFRRGKPTNHKVFGEAIAILAGDALLTEAFYLLSSHSNISEPNSSEIDISSDTLVRIISELAYAIGAKGMVAGQSLDILSEGKEGDIETLASIHKKKTGALITASVKMGGLLANCGIDYLKSLTRYGENIGLAFQIVDDILNVEGNSQRLGKSVGSDEKKQKLTYPKLYGIEESKRKAKELISEAIDSLSSFDQRADPLRGIALYLLEREK
ncbi:MAG: polyprenyl synthetase family protein [Thermodesulfovibrionales bacterium]|nr:polyprenyl synthetase family protein [Thermodesulfovibrionales bacterium]